MWSSIFMALFLFVASCWLYKGYHWQGRSGHFMGLVAGIFLTVLIPHCYHRRSSWIPPALVIKWVVQRGPTCRSELRSSMCHLSYALQQLMGKKGSAWLLLTPLISRAGDWARSLAEWTGCDVPGAHVAGGLWVECRGGAGVSQKAVLDK